MSHASASHARSRTARSGDDVTLRRSSPARAFRVGMALAAVVASAACADVLRTESGRGTLSVQITDAPMPGDAVESVDLFVVRVDARRAAADSSAAATSVDDYDAGEDGWITIATPNDRINLFAYRNGRALPIGLSTVPNGTYRAFRIVIDPSRSSVGLKGGAVLTAFSTPTAGFARDDRTGISISLAKPVIVRDGATTHVLVDFMAGESFVPRGTQVARSGLDFSPVVHATVR